MEVASLDLHGVLPRYRHSDKRLLLIDFEGTMWQRDMKILGRGIFNPPQEAIEALNRLAEDPKNEVWLLSGLPVKGMLDIVAEAAPKIGIV